MADYADNFTASGSLRFDTTTQIWTAAMHRLDGSQVHLDVPASLFPAARQAAQGGPGPWATFLQNSVSNPQVRSFQSQPRQDYIRQLFAFCPLPPLD